MWESIAILVAGAFAAWATVHQIGRQARLKLKLEIYREILLVRGRHGDAVRDISTKLHILQSQLGIWADPQKYGGFCPAPSSSLQQLNDLMHPAMMEAANIIVLTEQWRIVDPRLDLFQLGLGSASHDVRTAFVPFFQTATGVLPPVDNVPARPAEAKPETLRLLREQCAQVITALDRLDAWAHDFEQQMQNLLLADLFRNKLTPRVPADPSMFALTLERYDQLKRHFETETPWARERARIEGEVRKNFGAPAEGPLR